MGSDWPEKRQDRGALDGESGDPGEIQQNWRGDSSRRVEVQPLRVPAGVGSPPGTRAGVYRQPSLTFIVSGPSSFPPNAPRVPARPKSLIHCSLGTALNFPPSGRFPRAAALFRAYSPGCSSKEQSSDTARLAEHRTPGGVSPASTPVPSGHTPTQSHEVHRDMAGAQSYCPALPLNPMDVLAELLRLVLVC